MVSDTVAYLLYPLYSLKAHPRCQCIPFVRNAVQSEGSRGWGGMRMSLGIRMQMRGLGGQVSCVYVCASDDTYEWCPGQWRLRLERRSSRSTSEQAITQFKRRYSPCRQFSVSCPLERRTIYLDGMDSVEGRIGWDARLMCWCAGGGSLQAP